MQILNEYDKFPPGELLLIYLFTCAMALILIVSIEIYTKQESLARSLINVMFIILSSTALVYCIVYVNNDSHKHHYVEAKLKNDYPANKLLGQYKIVEIRGHIYVLEEKPKKEEIVEDNYG